MIYRKIAIVCRKIRKFVSKQLLMMSKRTVSQSKKQEDKIRLNKFIAASGVCSRREADKLIQTGRVKVNDKLVKELGTKVFRNDKVMVDNRPVQGEKKVYILLNKPKDVIATTDDPEGRLTVLDIIKTSGNERVFPVGRLDRNTTGVLLLTNDGELTSKLTHPRYQVRKVYEVKLNKGLKDEDLDKLLKGIELEDGLFKMDKISILDINNRKELGLEIHSGRNRIIRRSFEFLGYDVSRLDRVIFAGLTKKNLPRGKYRYLSPKEASFLKMYRFDK